MHNLPATRTHFRTCNLCEAMCGIKITVENERISAIQGDPDDPFSKGHLCPKATALQDIYEDPDRLRHPVRRTADGWQRITWEEAFDDVVRNLAAIQAQYGSDAVGVYQGNPNAHNTGSILYSPPFVRALRTRNRFSATSVDQLPHMFAALLMFGHQLLMPVPDIDHTDYWLILGGNPLASNGSIMTAAGVGKRLKAIQQRGGKVVVIDPRRTETADKADEHLFIRPGSDVFLLLALVNVLFSENLADPGRLAAFTDGFELLREAVRDYTPEAVAGKTGIPAETTRRLAREFAAAERAVCYGRVGVSMQAFGGLAQWLINAINIITGNFDRPGGALFTTPAVDVVGLTALTGQTGSFGKYKSRVRGLPAFGGELPASVMAEEMLTPGEGQIRAMITVAGNPVLSTPNGAQLDRAFAGLDYMVAIDIYINETTRHANVILPPTVALEGGHYDIVFHYLAVRNTAKYSEALFPPAAGALHDWQIFRELRDRLEAADPARRARIPRKLDFFKRLPPDKILDLALRFGPYGAWGGRRGQPETLNLRTLRRYPHGVDLGPLQATLPGKLHTPGKRINLAPELLLGDLPRAHAALTGHDDTVVNSGSLALIGRRHLRSNNSWMHNSERLVRGKNRCTLLIHPDDAAQRSIADGQVVEVRSRVGCVRLPAEVSETIMPGVVSIPHGWGHGRKGVQLDVAQRFAGVSINDLTDEQMLDDLTGNAAFSGVPVTVQGVAAG